MSTRHATHSRRASIGGQPASWPGRRRLDAALDAGEFVWLDIQAPTDADAQFLQDAFGFHALALEDALKAGQRAKIECQPDHYVLVIYAADYDRARAPGERLAVRALHVFLGDGFLVTVHPDPLPEVAETLGRVEGAGLEARTGAAAHALLDAVVDGYPVVLDALADEADALETRMFKGDQPSVYEATYQLKKELLRLRRHVGPARDVVTVLLRRERVGFAAEDEPYLHDLYDHAVRASEAIDQYRELLTGALDAHLAFESNRLNQVVKVLTVASIVLMTNALVAGIYGMNFDRMPELRWAYGYPFALGLMAALSVGLVVFFRRRGWL